MLRVKICGITNALDARFAAEAGADALGFVFAKSLRQISAASAGKIVRSLPLGVSAVGVFVDEKPADLLKTASKAGVHVVQLHGHESASEARLFQKNGFAVMKAFRVKGLEDLKRAAGERADAVLLDTFVAGLAGGTGQCFDWALLKKVSFSVPYFVSGGLNPKNLKHLLTCVKPYGVDVSSGVEKAPGKKDHRSVKEFIRNAKSA
jgi:phosphoribosylanthranilate isomerase